MTSETFQIGISYQEFVSEENQLSCSLQWSLPSANPMSTMYCASITFAPQQTNEIQNLERRLNELFALIPPEDVVKLVKF